MLNFLGDLREEIYFARATKPELRWLFRILDTGKALVNLTITAAFAFGIWCILDGDQKPGSPAPELIKSSPQVMAKKQHLAHNEQQSSERSFQIQKVTLIKPANANDTAQRINYNFQASVVLSTSSGNQATEQNNVIARQLLTPDIDISTLIKKLSVKAIQFESSFTPNPVILLPTL